MLIFEDGTDIYWARSRVLEYLNSIAGVCPKACRRNWGRMRPGGLGVPVRRAQRET